MLFMWKGASSEPPHVIDVAGLAGPSPQGWPVAGKTAHLLGQPEGCRNLSGASKLKQSLKQSF